MNRFSWLALGVGIIAVLAFFLVFNRPEEKSSSEIRGRTGSGVDSKRAVPKPSAAVPAVPSAVGEPKAGPASLPPRDEATVARIQAEILHASVQYHAASIPVISPYLSDTNSEVRHAALEGLVNLGEAGAVPAIQAAAARLQDPEEVAAFQEAADYLALPSAQKSGK